MQKFMLQKYIVKSAQEKGWNGLINNCNKNVPDLPLAHRCQSFTRCKPTIAVYFWYSIFLGDFFHILVELKQQVSPSKKGLQSKTIAPLFCKQCYGLRYIVIEVFPKMHVLKNNSWNLTTMRQQEWGGSTRNTKPSLLFHFRWHLLFVSTLLGLGRPMGWPTSVDLPGPMGWPMSVELTSPLTMSMGLGFG